MNKFEFQGKYHPISHYIRVTRYIFEKEGIGARLVRNTTSFLIEGLSSDYSDQKIEEIMAKVPAVPASIPAGSYKGQEKEWKGVGVVQTLAGRVSLPDDVVYKVVASIYDHFDEYVSYSGNDGAQLPAAINPGYFTYPVHAGAIKYYKEKGFWKKEHEEKQAKLLKELGLKK